MADEETTEVDWMKCDAETILDVINQPGGWLTTDWPHEADAAEKLIRLLTVLAKR